MRFLVLLTFLVTSLGAGAQSMPGMAMPKPQEQYLTQSAPPAEQARGTIVMPRASYVGKRVEYDLYVEDRMVNFTGKMRHAIGINYDNQYGWGAGLTFHY